MAKKVSRQDLIKCEETKMIYEDILFDIQQQFKKLKAKNNIFEAVDKMEEAERIGESILPEEIKDLLSYFGGVADSSDEAYASRKGIYRNAVKSISYDDAEVQLYLRKLRREYILKEKSLRRGSRSNPLTMKFDATLQEFIDLCRRRFSQKYTVAAPIIDD